MREKWRTEMKHSHIDHFLAISHLYFLIHEKNSENITEEEITELIVAINDMEASAEEAMSYLV